MPKDHRTALKEVRSFPSLVRYLRDELDWPISTEDFEELTFDYTAEELGIDSKNAAKIQEIKRLRPLVAKQPWGIFFVKFEPKRLPVVALRRILSQVVLKKRASANRADRTAWQADDLLFVSKFGEGDARQISFAHFSQDPSKADLPTLRVLGWDNLDTPLHVNHVADMLVKYLSWPADEGNTDMWRETWRRAFTLRHREAITTAKVLAERLAELARAIRSRIRTLLDIESDEGPLTKLTKAFQEALVHDLDADGFADMYAQTIAYGLLSARVTNPNADTADGLATQLPVTNPFLKELMETFLHVGGRRGETNRATGIDFDELGVSEVVELLDDANMDAVLRDFGDKNPQEDPVIHFYERFLREYDAKKRMQRGVFYTPRPVVSYIVRSVDELLRTEFGLEDGLADMTTWGELARRVSAVSIPPGIAEDEPFVVILDPATGTGTFLVETIDLIHRCLVKKWTREGHNEVAVLRLWNEYVPKHLLPRLHGYELLMAPYAIAHLKIGLKLHETGYAFANDTRVRVFLTNALESAHDFSGQFEFAIPALAHEAEAVNRVKRHQRFTVVFGNPPYSKMSGNLGPDAVALVEPFRSVDGQRIVEKGALALELNLQDDYVKFWGLLCRKMQECGIGVASFITNSRYLASPTLRGLRAHIRANFARGFFLDLGGQVSERKSVGSTDENVFEIEQGVSIGAIVAAPRKSPIESVLYGRILGNREAKYSQLASSTLTSLSTLIAVTPPLYRFARSTDDFDEEFESWPRLDELMPFNSGSIITSRDNLAIDRDRKQLLQKIERFATSKKGDRSLEKEIGYSAKAKWDVEKAKKDIRSIEPRGKAVKQILYRPFDQRFIYYVPALLDTPSKPVCDSIFGHENLVLLTPGVKTGSDFSHVLVSRTPAEKKAVSHDRATQMFPLFRFEGPEAILAGKTPNIVGSFLRHDAKAAFDYVYAILHSPQYRRRYGNALRDSYPRIPPPPSDRSLLDKLVMLGERLVSLHLLETVEQTSISARFDKAKTEWCFDVAKGARVRPRIAFKGPPSPLITRAGWSNNTIWIDAVKPRGATRIDNGTSGFHGVPEDVWKFEIGGYQVCEKWLKDRKGSTLTSDDLAHYYRVIVALAETIRVMQEIDKVIDAHGGWPGAFGESAKQTDLSASTRKAAESSAPYAVDPAPERTRKRSRHHVGR